MATATKSMTDPFTETDSFKGKDQFADATSQGNYVAADNHTNQTRTSQNNAKPRRAQRQPINLNQEERWLSSFSGGALAIYGLRQGGLSGVLLTVAGGGLLYRGLSGHCAVYEALNINAAASPAARASVRHGHGLKVEQSVTINQPAEKLFRFWRNFQNLPQFMQHLESVQVLDQQHSRWRAKAPAGTSVEWEAEIINEIPNELISWRSLENAEIANAGSVRFESQANGRGTRVRVSLNYEPPGGKVGQWLAKLFGEEPNLQVQDDLHRFKQLMEAGEVATVTGQTSGRAAKA